jgi:release factor glutamine methyltransferase
LALGTQAKTIYEIGTGSGAVAIALAKQLPEIKIVVSDVSNPALAVARWNIRHYKLTNQIKTIRSHLGQHIKQPSLIVANLPYLPTSLEPRQELMFEPKLALYADDNGLALYKELFNQTNFTAAVIELGANQYQPMIEWLANKFPRAKIDSVKDIDGTICGLQILAG